jgi:HK97 gp10 family phage protein
VHISVKSTLRMDPWKRKVEGLPANIQEALQETGDEIVDDIRANWSGQYPPASAPGQAPAKRSGDLDASIDAQPLSSASSGTVFQVTISVKSPGSTYAGYLEYGTGKMAARPFIRPAVARARGTLRAKLKVALDK